MSEETSLRPQAPDDKPGEEVGTIQFLRNVLADSAKQFRHYESLHSRKGTPDGDEKALVNAAHALACESAVAMGGVARGDDVEVLANILGQLVYGEYVRWDYHSSLTQADLINGAKKIIAAGYHRQAPAPENSGGIHPAGTPGKYTADDWLADALKGSETPPSDVQKLRALAVRCKEMVKANLDNGAPWDQDLWAKYGSATDPARIIHLIDSQSMVRATPTRFALASIIHDNTESLTMTKAEAVADAILAQLNTQETS